MKPLIVIISTLATVSMITFIGAFQACTSNDTPMVVEEVVETTNTDTQTTSDVTTPVVSDDILDVVTTEELEVITVDVIEVVDVKEVE